MLCFFITLPFLFQTPASKSLFSSCFRVLNFPLQTKTTNIIQKLPQTTNRHLSPILLLPLYFVLKQKIFKRRRGGMRIKRDSTEYLDRVGGCAYNKIFRLILTPRVKHSVSFTGQADPLLFIRFHLAYNLSRK